MKLIRTTFGKLKIGDLFRDRGETDASIMIKVDPKILGSRANAVDVTGIMAGKAL